MEDLKNKVNYNYKFRSILNYNYKFRNMLNKKIKVALEELHIQIKQNCNFKKSYKDGKITIFDYIFSVKKKLENFDRRTRITSIENYINKIKSKY